jgi:hypothetical protein
MDDQNWIEKIGIIRDLGDIKTTLVKQNGELDFIKTQRGEMHDELKKLIQGFNLVIYGNGKPGLITLVDRLVQTDANRRANFMVIYASLIGVAVKFVYDFVKK